MPMVSRVHKQRLMHPASIVLILQLTACAGGPAVRQVDEKAAFRTATSSALDCDEPSAVTKFVLLSKGMADLTRRERTAALDVLAEQVCVDRNRNTCFALSELCYLEARRFRATPEERMKYSLSSAVYALSFLRDEAVGAPPSPYDMQFRQACDFYNHALAQFACLYIESTTDIQPIVELPLLRGKLIAEVHGAHADYLKRRPGTTYLNAFQAEASDIVPHSRQTGLGAPVVVVQPKEYKQVMNATDEFYMPKGNRAFPLTLILELEKCFCENDSPDDALYGSFHVLSPADQNTWEMDGDEIPLSADFTLPLAYMLKSNKPLNLFAFMRPQDDAQFLGLRMLHPYQRGKIPLVFTHGLLSAPHTWGRMLNALYDDPVLRERYQIWFFRYPTGNPVLYSAHRFRSALYEARKRLDPDGTDAAWDQMVLIGHSMGGLLTKTAVQHSQGEVWSGLSTTPIDEMDISEDDKALLHELVEFEPVPFVKRVIFISTPHRGSKLSTGFLGWLATSLVHLPGNLAQSGANVISQMGQLSGIAGLDPHKAPTSIQGLMPSNPVLKSLDQIPIEESVPYHTIEGNNKAADTPGGTDGVVPYSSSHLEGAKSEKIVKSGHNAHDNPVAVAEVRRILLEHIDAAEAADAPVITPLDADKEN